MVRALTELERPERRYADGLCDELVDMLDNGEEWRDVEDRVLRRRSTTGEVTTGLREPCVERDALRVRWATGPA